MKDFWRNGIKSASNKIGKNLAGLEEEWLMELARLDASTVQYQVT